MFVGLRVDGVHGGEVASLVNERNSSGTYEVSLDGIRLSSGVHIYRMELGSFVRTKKLMLLK